MGFALGAAAVLTKPVDRGELAETIRAQIQRATTPATVLIVEDDRPTRELTERAVEKLGHTAALAENGRHAIDWLEANPPPALILLDLLMPEMDGLEFLRELRSRADWMHIPVVVVTAKQLTAEDRAHLAENTQHVIAKGQSAYTDLAHAVRRVLAQPVSA